MNALVNDQVDRLYDWLQGQDAVTLFHFTSETPEDKTAANRLGIGRWDACRMRTRRQARGLETAAGLRIALGAQPQGPVPDVVITNYSMLEYMLCRPQDAPFFGTALRSLVLDEAHLYTGTLAAEITLLLRRPPASLWRGAPTGLADCHVGHHRQRTGRRARGFRVRPVQQAARTGEAHLG